MIDLPDDLYKEEQHFINEVVAYAHSHNRYLYHTLEVDGKPWSVSKLCRSSIELKLQEGWEPVEVLEHNDKWILVVWERRKSS
jgi:hypothetical protein